MRTRRVGESERGGKFMVCMVRTRHDEKEVYGVYDACVRNRGYGWR
jgi:hypothetical protein